MAETVRTAAGRCKARRMDRSTRNSIILGLVTLVVVAVGYAAVQARSQAVLQTRWPLVSSTVHAATAPTDVAAGQHLVQVTGCSLCHGRDLAGKMMAAAGSPMAAPNLTRAVAKRSDAELDRAIRAGVRPDATSEFAMPSHVYAAFTDAETADIIGYLRTLKSTGAVAVRPPLGVMQKVDLAIGFMHPEAGRIAGAPRPLDAGAQFQAGRHLASLACAQCHGTDLTGGHGAPGPDLMVRGGYSLAQFRTLMHDGETPAGRELGLMSLAARQNFSHFSDAEVGALYAYLAARDVKLGPAQKASS